MNKHINLLIANVEFFINQAAAECCLSPPFYSLMPIVFNGKVHIVLSAAFDGFHVEAYLPDKHPKRWDRLLGVCFREGDIVRIPVTGLIDTIQELKNQSVRCGCDRDSK